MKYRIYAKSYPDDPANGEMTLESDGLDDQEDAIGQAQSRFDADGIGRDVEMLDETFLSTMVIFRVRRPEAPPEEGDDQG